jgi:hypothetical protein
MPAEKDIPTRALPEHTAPDQADADEIGCDYCRNDGKLSPEGVCPKCDAQWLEDAQ